MSIAATQLGAAAPASAPPAAAAARKLSRSELARCLWSFRKEIAWVGVFSFFANLLLLAPTVYMLQVFDRVMLSGNQLTLAALSLITLLFYLVMGVAEWLRSRLLVRAGAKFDQAINARIFDASFDATLDGPARNPSQPFTDLTQMRQFLSGPGAFAFFDLPWIPVYLGVLFMMHPVLGWSAIGFAVLLLAVALLGQRYTSPRNERAATSVVALNAHVHSRLRHAETVQALGMLGNLRRRWLDAHAQNIEVHDHAYEANHRIQATVKFLQFSQQSLILAIGALLAIDGKIGVGAMIASNALMANALRPITTFVNTWRTFVESRQAWRRLADLLDRHPPHADAIGSADVKGQITLRGLVARAPGRERPILDGLTAEFKAGEVVAIVGPSGAGKSTLARCLVDVWPDVSGEVLLDGQPMRHWSRDALGPRIGYLPQDIELMDGTIAENIARFGAVDSAAVIEAAKRTGIHELVLRFPKGYDTPMGEAGGLLSGGQRQRIGLARALYGDPNLLVLDEPNASLDDAGEAALIRTVRDLRARGKTVFMIVHQKQYLAVADRVLVLQDGRIVQLAQVTVERPSTSTEVVKP